MSKPKSDANASSSHVDATSSNQESHRAMREPVWRAMTPADPPKPRRVALILSLVALAAWAAFLAYLAWA